MKNVKSIFFIPLFILLILACSNKTKNDQHENHEHNENLAETVNSELVREGIIDVESIDKNKDGNLYECPMDWNVINDEKGNCPVCGMKLKEYTIAEIKENLNKYGYDYKN